MSDEPVFLKPNIVVEPLVGNWYAWAHLIPPATAAMNFANRHLPIMESYVNSPNVHRAAAKNPAAPKKTAVKDGTLVAAVTPLREQREGDTAVPTDTTGSTQPGGGSLPPGQTALQTQPAPPPSQPSPEPSTTPTASPSPTPVPAVTPTPTPSPDPTPDPVPTPKPTPLP